MSRINLFVVTIAILLITLLVSIYPVQVGADPFIVPDQFGRSANDNNGIYGNLKINGAVASNIPINLRFNDGNVSSIVNTTKTDDSGNYLFVDADSLELGEMYFVTYGPNELNPAQVYFWYGLIINEYTKGDNVSGGDFDLSDVPLIRPSSGVTISLPVTFNWESRGIPNDTYRIVIMDFNGDQFWRSSDLGNTDSYTLESLFAGMEYNSQYAWYVEVYSEPDSYGESFQVNDIVFYSKPATPDLELNEARWNHSATLLPDGKVLIVGGENSEGPIASAELYDPVSNKFELVGNLNQFRADHTATLLPDGKVLITGGKFTYSYLDSLRSAELFDPNTRQFKLVGEMHSEQALHTATFLQNNKVLIVGNGHYAELYDPDQEKFSDTKGPTVSPRREHSATMLANSKVLIAGGKPWGGFNELNYAELYNPTTDEFVQTGRLIHPRAGHTATLLESGKVLIVSGYSHGTNEGSESELFDPQTGNFTVTSKLDKVITGAHSATLLTDGRVLITGGWANGSTEATQIYSPETGSFSRSFDMQTSRAYHTATRLQNGTILVVGGWYVEPGEPGYAIDDAELIDVLGSSPFVYLPIVQGQ